MVTSVAPGSHAARCPRLFRRKGEVIPWSLIEQQIRDTHPYEVFMVRAMLAVPYLEKALYELPEDQLSVPTLLKMADDIENNIQVGMTVIPADWLLF